MCEKSRYDQRRNTDKVEVLEGGAVNVISEQDALLGVQKSDTTALFKEDPDKTVFNPLDWS